MTIADPASLAAFNDALPGLLAGTPVMTPQGPVPVETLEPGDRVITRRGIRRIAGTVTRRTARARLVRISPRVLDAATDAPDILVAPGQPILLRDWRARALAGSAEALLPAARLCEGSHMRIETRRDAMFVTLGFEAAEVVFAGGVEVSMPPAVATTPDLAAASA